MLPLDGLAAPAATASAMTTVVERPELPSEIVVEILLLLPLYPLIRCRQVSRRLRNIIDHTEELQYQIDLRVAGYDEGWLSGERRAFKFNVRERRDALRRHVQTQKRTRDFIWRPVAVPVAVLGAFVNRGPNGPFTFYSGNVYISCDGDPPLVEQDLMNSVCCLSFSSPPTGEEGSVVPKLWGRTVSEAFTMVGVDPRQNLLVLARATPNTACGGIDLSIRQYQLRSRKAEHEHEMVVNIRTRAAVESIRSAIHIHRNTIALVVFAQAWRWSPFSFQDPPSKGIEVVFIDRKECTTFARYRLGDSLSMAFAGRRLYHHATTANFVLLDDSTFLLVYPGPVPNVQVFLLGDKSQSKTPDEFRNYVRVAAFEFPARKEPSALEECFMECTLHSDAQLSDISKATKSPLFTPSRSNSLLILSYTVVNLTQKNRLVKLLRGTKCAIQHVIRLAPFLEAVEAYIAGQRFDEPIAWEQWGPRNSRTLMEPIELFGSGSCIFLRRKLNDKEYVVWDFNALAYQKESSEEAAGPRKNRLTGLLDRTPRGRVVGADEPSVIPRGVFFTQDIIGRLPYREVVSTLPSNRRPKYESRLSGYPAISTVWQVQNAGERFEGLQYMYM